MVWEGRQDQVLEMQASALLDAKCMKDMWMEHKKTCKVLSEAQQRAREVALSELGGKQPWTGLDEIPSRSSRGTWTW